jgi:hypothetical protein
MASKTLAIYRAKPDVTKTSAQQQPQLDRPALPSSGHR